MCGRYTLRQIDRMRRKYGIEDVGHEHFDPADEMDDHPVWRPRFNVAPMQQIPVILDAAPRRLSAARWGLVPSWSKDDKRAAGMINARGETVATTAAYRSAFKRQRCLILADGFYEWQATGSGKVPHHFTLRTDEPFAFAGIWETWRLSPDAKPLRTAALITTTPNSVVAPVHNRMPVILRPENESAWLDPATPQEVLLAMLGPYPAELMKEAEASKRVNSPRQDDPTLLTPGPAAGDLL